MEGLQISFEHSKNHHYGSVFVGVQHPQADFSCWKWCFCLSQTRDGSTRYGSLGSYVSFPLVIKTTHLKDRVFNFLFIICRKTKSDFYYSLLMTEENAFHEPSRFLTQETSWQEISMGSLTDVETDSFSFNVLQKLFVPFFFFWSERRGR